MVDKYDPYLERYLKEYQDNPRSRIFAPLAEAYRKSGLVDEAIEICKEGLQYHPNFISGMVALARAYLDKGLYTATIRELEKVISEAPDNYLAQKLLAQSYLLVGDNDNALKAYKMVTYLNPKDEESKTAIVKLEARNQELLEESLDEVLEEVEEDAPLLPFSDYANDADLGFEEKNISSAFSTDTTHEESSPNEILTNISTMTMGDLLASQGHKEKALEVYRKILEQNPEQLLIKQKIEELEQELGLNLYDSADQEPEHDLVIENAEEKDKKPEDISSVHIIDDSTKIPTKSKISYDVTDEELDEDWIFKDPVENITLLKLKSLLNKIRLYRFSSS